MRRRLRELNLASNALASDALAPLVMVLGRCYELGTVDVRRNDTRDTEGNAQVMEAMSAAKAVAHDDMVCTARPRAERNAALTSPRHPGAPLPQACEHLVWRIGRVTLLVDASLAPEGRADPGLPKTLSHGRSTAMPVRRRRGPITGLG